MLTPSPQCDNDEDCVYCFDDRTLDPDRQNWQYDCKRGPLATELEAAFSGIIRGTCLRHRPGNDIGQVCLSCIMAYGDLKIAVSIKF